MINKSKSSLKINHYKIYKEPNKINKITYYHRFKNILINIHSHNKKEIRLFLIYRKN